MTRKGFAMLNKTMFAIFLVIFVLFVFFTVVKNRTESKSEKVHYDLYDSTNKFVLAFLSNPNCLSVGNEIDKKKFTTVQGVLDVQKLDKYDRDNEDMWCIENFEFLYSIEVKETDPYAKSWLIGLTNTNPFWADRVIRFDMPGIVRYEDGTAHLSHIIMSSYVGDIPRLYADIKKTCLLKDRRTLDYTSKYDIEYIAANNSLHIESDYFFPYFSCGVEDFEIDKGNRLVFITYEDEHVKVRS